MAAKALIIGDVEFPIMANGYSVSREKIWSKNTGRTDSGDMAGTIIAVKTKIEVTLQPMTPEMAGIIDSIVSDIKKPFQSAKILNVDGTTRNIMIYTGNITYPFVSTALGENSDGLISGVKLSVIEQ